ncbi:MAG: hypothetical protein ABEH66_02680 [Halobacteriales archaeon]
MNGLVFLLSWRVLAAIAEPGFDVDIGPGVGLGGGAVGAFFTTLVVGAIMIAVLPGYTERTMASVLDEPVDSFLHGILLLLALVVVTVALVVTILGIVLAIPLILAAYLAWAVGSTIAYLAIADRLVGREDGWPKPLFVAAVINGGLALSGVGGIVAFCVGAVGVGAVFRGR